MNWSHKTVFFPAGRLDEQFLNEYLDRYTIDTSAEQQYIDGVPVYPSPTIGDDVALSTIFKDNYPLTRFRKASIFDGTIEPTLVYDPPLVEGEDPAGRTPIGSTITVCWPESFLNDIENHAPEDAQLFEDVRVVISTPTEPTE